MFENYRDLQQANFSLRKDIDYHLLSLGVYTKPLNRYSISTVHGEKEKLDLEARKLERPIEKRQLNRYILGVYRIYFHRT